MGIQINEYPTLSAFPAFVPFGVLCLAMDTGDLYIGTGAISPNVELIGGPNQGRPSGFSGDIQYNNGLGGLGGSAATIDAAGDLTIPVAATLAVGGTLSDGTGSAGTNGQVLSSTGTGVLWIASTGGGGGGTPGGSTGAIQFNNGGVFAGSTATVTTAGSITIPLTQSLFFGTNDTNISRHSGGVLAIGVGSQGNETGGIILNTINLGGDLFDSTDYAGANGWLLSSTGSGILWVAPPTGPSSFSPITNEFLTGYSSTSGTFTAGQPILSGIGNPNASITFAFGIHGFNRSYTTGAVPGTFNEQITATTAATSATNQNSPATGLSGNYWNGGASAGDEWREQVMLGAGTNPTSTLIFSHIGSTGVAAVQVPTFQLLSDFYDESDSTGIFGQSLVSQGGGGAGVLWSWPNIRNVVSTSGSRTLLSTDEIVLISATATATLNSGLPPGTAFTIKNTSASGTVTAIPTSGNLDTYPSVALSSLDSLDVVFDGTNWWII
jgi:hypothetical protein